MYEQLEVLLKHKGGSKVQFLGQVWACNSAPIGPNNLKCCIQMAFVGYHWVLVKTRLCDLYRGQLPIYTQKEEKTKDRPISNAISFNTQKDERTKDRPFSNANSFDTHKEERTKDKPFSNAISFNTLRDERTNDRPFSNAISYDTQKDERTKDRPFSNAISFDTQKDERTKGRQTLLQCHQFWYPKWEVQGHFICKTFVCSIELTIWSW